MIRRPELTRVSAGSHDVIVYNSSAVLMINVVLQFILVARTYVLNITFTHEIREIMIQSQLKLMTVFKLNVLTSERKTNTRNVSVTVLEIKCINDICC